MTPRCLAVVPARGGSKGLPGKNIRELLGIPLIAHSLRCASMVPQITRVVVSTDDEEIAAKARESGADVPFMRPSSLASDSTPMMPVLAHAVSAVEQLESSEYDLVLLLDPTSPCRLPEDIERAFRMLEADTEADGVIACSKPHFNPYWVGVAKCADGSITPAFPGAEGVTRRQDVPDFFRINGALYLWRRPFVDTAESVMEGRQLLLEIDEERAFSIDTESDFRQLNAVLDAGLVTFPWMKAS